MHRVKSSKTGRAKRMAITLAIAATPARGRAKRVATPLAVRGHVPKRSAQRKPLVIIGEPVVADDAGELDARVLACYELTEAMVA